MDAQADPSRRDALSVQSLIAELNRTSTHAGLLKLLGIDWGTAVDTAGVVAAIRGARARAAAIDLYRLETACAALISTRALLNRLDNRGCTDMAHRVVSRSQWLVYFSCEIRQLSPAMSTVTAFWLAVGVYDHASGTSPEVAAVSMAAGTRLIALH